MATAAPASSPPKGRLAYNAQMVGSLQAALSHADSNLNAIPGLVRLIADNGCWLAFKFPEASTSHTWNAADFRQFIESPRPAGCETPIGVLERTLRGTDAWETYLGLTRGERGAPEGHPVYADRDPDTGRLTPINRNNITDNGEPDTIPFDPAAPRERDYSRESKQGTSVSYALRRLDRQRPDLLERVRAGELSPNAAMIAAGFRPKAITIPAEPRAAARRLVRHFSREQFNELVEAALDAYGVRAPPEGGA